MKYELIREIFNKCSGNQMRDVFVSAVSTEDTDLYIKDFFAGSAPRIEKQVKDDVIIYDVENDGLRERFAFTPDD